MPLATDQQFVKTYGKLPWWRGPAHFRKLLKRSVETSSVIERQYEFEESEHPRVPAFEATGIKPGSRKYAQLSQNSCSFASTQFNLPNELQAKCKAWVQAHIDPQDLSPLESQDDAFHITVRYGLHDPDIREVEATLKGYGPVSIELGRVEQFETDEYDVLIVPVKDVLAQSYASDFDESEHPREDDGKFAPKGGGEDVVKKSSGLWYPTDRQEALKAHEFLRIGFKSSKKAEAAAEIVRKETGMQVEVGYDPYERGGERFRVMPIVRDENYRLPGESDDEWLARLSGSGVKFIQQNGSRKAYQVKLDPIDLTIKEFSLLTALRTALSSLPCTDTHSDYRPHVTLAYVQKGKGQKYLGDASFLGDTATLDRLRYSDSKEQISWISLLPKSYAEKLEEGAEDRRGQLRQKIRQLIAKHPDWTREQIKAAVHGKEIPKVTQENFAQASFSRTLTPYERKVDFAILDSETKKLASQGTERVKQLLTQSKDKLLSLIASKHKAGTLTSKFVLDLELRGLGQLVPTLREALSASFRLGQREASKELKKTFAQYASDFDESEHPREEDGKFAPKGKSDNETDEKAEAIRNNFPVFPQDKLKSAGWYLEDYQKRWIEEGLVKLVMIPISRARQWEYDPPLTEDNPTIQNMLKDWASNYRLPVIEGRLENSGSIKITDGQHRLVAWSMHHSQIPLLLIQSMVKKHIHSYQVKLDPTGLPPEKALEFFERKAVLWGADIRQPLLGEVKNILFDGMKQGTPLRELMERIKQVYLPWLGDPDQAIDEIMLTPYRLETLVRTNVTEALNEGRKAQYQEAVDDGFVIGLAYSAVLDARTTEVCRHLDEKIFPPNSPDLDRLTPPRHFNCRAILTPVTRLEGPVQYISPAQVAKGIELSGKGFSEESDSRQYEFDESEHPREDDGKFAPKGSGESSNAKSEDAIRAVGEGKERTFVNADGSPVDAATQERINALGIPPGWTGVQVSADPNSPLQAIGYDKSGKEQPRYSKAHTTAANAAKHLRVAALAQDGYKKMVSGVQRDMLQGKEEAVVMRLVLASAMRVGGDSETAYGATTLEARHLSVEDDQVRFDFPGKSGKHWQGTIRDANLAKQVRTRLEGKSGTDRVFSTSAGKVNAYLKQYGKTSVKDVRTLQGTAVAMKELKALGEPKTLKEAKQHIKLVCEKVAEHLRNTPAVAKSSYINPAVWAPIQAKFGIPVTK